MGKLTVLGICLITSIAFCHPAVAEQTIIKKQIVGAWSLVAVTAERADGSNAEAFGTNPKGIIIFTDSGHFSLFQSRADLPKLAENDRGKATPEEAMAVVRGSIAYYGTYSVNETDKSLSVEVFKSKDAFWDDSANCLATREGSVNIVPPQFAASLTILRSSLYFDSLS